MHILLGPTGARLLLSSDKDTCGLIFLCLFGLLQPMQEMPGMELPQLTGLNTTLTLNGGEHDHDNFCFTGNG